MKLHIAGKFRSQEGSTFMMAMLLVLATVPLALSYMLATQQQYKAVDRSQTWSSALPAAEAGVEEAFAHLNADCYSNEVNTTEVWNNGGWTADTWTYTNKYGVTGTAKGLKSPTHYVGTNYYQITLVTNATTDPKISSITPQIVAKGYAPTVYDKRGTNIPRQLRVETKLYFFNSYPIQSLSDIESKGQGIFVAAYTPTNFGGVYTTTNQLVAQGGMVSIEGSISFSGQGTVWGNLSTSPNGEVDLGTKTTVTGTTDNTVNTELLDPPFDTTAASAWPLLSACYCNGTYTNVTLIPVPITTNVSPNPPPAGGILTNDSGLYTAYTKPAGISDSDVVSTNLEHIANSLTKPLTNYSYLNLVTNTNTTSVWTTNWAPANSYTSYPTYPAAGTYDTSQAILTGWYEVGFLNGSGGPANYLSAAPDINCYDTSRGYNWVQNNTNGNAYDRTKINGVWSTNCHYFWKQYYAYKTGANTYTYSWDYVTYTYKTTTYTYMGTNTTETTTTRPFKYIATTGKWTTGGDLSLNSEAMLIQGDVTIYVPGTFSMSGNSTIIIPYGSKLTLYFGGDASLSGNGGIVNLTGRAQNLTMFGLPTCSRIDISGNASFTGTVYAPEAAVSLKGSGNNNYDVVGAITGKTVTVDGKFGVIYPTDLATSGPVGGFVASKWTEEKVGVGP